MSGARRLAVFLAIIISLLTLSFYRSHIFALHFVDEDDNIVIGNYLREGQSLYSEVFSQHQPSMFVISSWIQSSLSIDNVLMVIKRHREFMIAWSILWFLILTARFGWPLLLSGAVIELAKISLLGNLYLAESLVIYPLLYFVAHVFSPRKNISISEKIILSLIFWILWYSLTPLWPVLIMLAFVMYVQTATDKQFHWIFLAIAGFFLLGLISTTTIYDYFYNALHINYKYYIPLTTPVGFFESIFKAFFAPLMAIISPKTGELLILIRILSVGLIINLAALVLHKKIIKAITIVIVLGLTSLRYIDPGDTLYGVFHMLPWFVLLVVFNFIPFTKIRLHHIVIWLIILISSLSVASRNLFDYRDPATDFYVHFSPSSDIREAVKILTQSSPQTIWVEPVSYYPHWRTGATPYTKMINYYAWMDKTEPMKSDLVAHLKNELPTIVWAETQLGIGEYLGHYSAIKRDGKPSGLYLRSDKAKEITPQTRQDLLYYRFEIN